MNDHNSRETELHTLYLSDTVWGELKQRAVMEGSGASKLTDYVLRDYLKRMPAVELPQRRSRAETGEKLERRSLHLQKGTWKRIAEIAQEEKFSVSTLTEFLLRSYLGLEITADLQPRLATNRRPTMGRQLQLPEGLWPYFQEYNPAQLNLQRDADLIIQRTLEFGTWEEVRWLFTAFGKQHVSAFLRKRGERLLTPVAFNYWHRLLGIEEWQASPFPIAKGELWDR